MWGCWHFLVAALDSGDAESNFSFELFFPWVIWNLLVMPAYRVLMVYVFQLTERSVLAMSVMHGTLTASLPLILTPPAAGLALASFYSLVGVTLMTIDTFIIMLGWDKQSTEEK